VSVSRMPWIAPDEPAALDEVGIERAEWTLDRNLAETSALSVVGIINPALPLIGPNRFDPGQPVVLRRRGRLDVPFTATSSA
jgi:hypothetical protein